MKYEVCCGSLESCDAAAKAGAHRVELCSALALGGVTPSYGVISTALKYDNILVNVLIRPREGDFVYSDTEISAMIEDIKICKDLGVNGVVIGCLTPDWRVDMRAMRMLIEHCEGLEVTFHRAFDHVINPLEALEDIISLGCDRILTSGGRVTAQVGVTLLSQLVKKASARIIIMAGCGINSENVLDIVQNSKVPEIHFSASVTRNEYTRKHNLDVDFGSQPSVSSYDKIVSIIKLVETNLI